MAGRVLQAPVSGQVSEIPSLVGVIALSGTTAIPRKSVFSESTKTESGRLKHGARTLGMRLVCSNHCNSLSADGYIPADRKNSGRERFGQSPVGIHLQSMES